jgi:hypothetical protein
LNILISPFPPPMMFDHDMKTINEVLPHRNGRGQDTSKLSENLRSLRHWKESRL